jgi:cation diffusion facilitator CzcD-associated flavoprotein CzcO
MRRASLRANGCRFWVSLVKVGRKYAGVRAAFGPKWPLPVESVRPAPHSFQVAIIGAGFAGVCMAIKLKEAGIDDFVILENGEEAGGTWRDNTYPGCACDVPSHLYSYSFRLHGEWSEVFPPWREIRDYIADCVRHYGLKPHLRLRTAVKELRFDEKFAGWELALSDGQQIRARFVVAATGPLTKPLLPDIPGLDSFRSHKIHSARWDHGFPLDGKRVAVIGTGASAIQIVPAIARKVAQLHVFQRTAPWVLPRYNRRYGKAARWIYRRFPAARRFTRWLTYWRLEAFAPAVLRDGLARRFFEFVGRCHLRLHVPDAALRERLRPRFRLGCKRVLLSDSYYRALQLPQAELVTDKIAGFTADGVVTDDGKERRVDAVIFATGFRATEFVSPLRIYGKEGRELSEMWKRDATSYLGISVAGFPNLFLLVGPNTGLGHSSIIFMIEAQVRYVIDAIRTAKVRSLRRIEVRPDAEAAFQEEIQSRLRGTAWMSGCQSFYLSDNGKTYMMWPGTTVEYWRRTQRFDPAKYLCQ